MHLTLCIVRISTLALFICAETCFADEVAGSQSYLVSYLIHSGIRRLAQLTLRRDRRKTNAKGAGKRQFEKKKSDSGSFPAIASMVSTVL